MEEYLHSFKEIAKGRGLPPLNPMECGIFITLLEPIFPRHHRKEWPAQKNGAKPGVQKNSEKYLQFSKYTYFQERVSVARWSWKCMDGVYRAFMKTRQSGFLKSTLPAAI
jgi:hypothetical protein